MAGEIAAAFPLGLPSSHASGIGQIAFVLRIRLHHPILGTPYRTSNLNLWGNQLKGVKNARRPIFLSACAWHRWTLSSMRLFHKAHRQAR